MAWTGLNLTVDGRSALNRAQADRHLNFKSIVVGDGNPPGNFGTIKELVHQLFELTELKIDMTDDGCMLTADLPDVDYDYYMREIGVIVTTEDGEKLYVYDNCGSDAQYIVSTTGAEKTKKRVRLSLMVSDVENITVSHPSVLYVSYDDFDDAVAKLKHGDDTVLEDAKTYTDGMYRQATGYTDTKIADLIGGAPETLDTLKEVADAIQENETVVEALDAAIGRKANQTELDTHVDNETIHITADERTKWNGYEEEIEGLNNNLTEKQPYLSCGKFTGNIDSVNSDGFGGYLRDNSIVWVHNTEASGTHPDGAEYYILETFSVDLGILTQRAIKYIYQAAPNIFTRIFVNGEWSPWTDTAKLINNATTHYSGLFEIPELGIGYNTELNALIEGGLVPAGKTVELWCNNDTPIGKSVRADIEATYSGADFYGYLEVHRTGDGATVFLTARAFNSLDTYVNRWSNINSVGWQTAWKRI